MEYDEDVLSFQGKQKTAVETFEKREQTLKGLEDALRQKDEELNGEKGILQQLKVELEEREAAIAVREEQSTLLSAFAQIENADQTLKRLEDIFSCSLACPYSLASPGCGHSFCAMCILQWFFSGLHRGCGGWHEDPMCPLCRAVLPVPGNIESCPFTPNRLADEIIQQYLNELASVPALPDEDGSIIDQNTSKGKGKGKSLPEYEIVPWREGGSARRDWLERERAGRLKMEYLTSNWVTLFKYQFIEFKDSIGA
ncbi:hypothetical protein PHLCEN_2v1219 [Hermanssonia centrifuga]|uniref:RING-type domain-containing protein n=1 Tax=Hermanssonia centrifuga TaxID=98765 RepID=A0A2R6S3V8_9APHY|nr:hypothetical protein PHLCEN_2v1219 [Hermanssonia centrifuga]